MALEPTVVEQTAIVDMMIARAQGRIDTQLHDAEALALKALGVLAVDAAALALLISVLTTSLVTGQCQRSPLDSQG